MTPERKREINIGLAMVGTHGEIVILSCGRVGTINALFRKARANGFNGCGATFAKRIKSGCRDFSELCKPVIQENSENSKVAIRKRKEDPEFLAALAAVNARRGKR